MNEYICTKCGHRLVISRSFAQNAGQKRHIRSKRPFAAAAVLNYRRGRSFVPNVDRRQEIYL